MNKSTTLLLLGGGALALFAMSKANAATTTPQQTTNSNAGSGYGNNYSSALQRYGSQVASAVGNYLTGLPNGNTSGVPASYTYSSSGGYNLSNYI